VPSSINNHIDCLGGKKETEPEAEEKEFERAKLQTILRDSLTPRPPVFLLIANRFKSLLFYSPILIHVLMKTKH
jgi:hypothetical protein